MIDGNLRIIFRERVPPPCHWQAIETGLTSPGVPDTNLCMNGAERWIEFKQTPGWAVSLRPEQIGWLTTRERHGGVTYVAIRRCPSQGGIDELWMYRGHWARELRSQGLRGKTPVPLICATGGPARWPWDLIHKVLLHGRDH